MGTGHFAPWPGCGKIDVAVRNSLESRECRSGHSPVIFPEIFCRSIVVMSTDAPPLRVLFLSPYFRPYLGGIERAIERLSFQLLESSAVESVGVLTTKYAFPRVPHPEWPNREKTPEGISIFRLSGFPRRSMPLYSVPLVWFSPGQIRRYLDEFDPHIIHFVGDGWFWGHFWAWLWRRKNARFVFTPSYHTLPASRVWLKQINRFISRRMHQVVTLTGQEALQVSRDYRVRQEKISVVGWGASVLAPDEEPSDQPEPVVEKPVTILSVGRLSRHKGQSWLIDVYRQARSQFQSRANLVLVGRDEDSETQLRAQVREAGLQGEVEFAGELDDESLSRRYNQADIFALYSHYEAFGLVYLEAMLCGLPVLTHEVGSNRELLIHGAVVTPRFDQEAAITQLVRLVNDSDYRTRLGEEGRTYAQEEFTWQSVAEKYLAIYRQQSPGG